MKIAAALLALFVIADAPQSGPAIPYFTNLRDVHIAQPDRQNYFVVDEELWNHSRSDLSDLRLYDGDSLVQYYLSEQRAGIASDEVEARILNLGSVRGHTEFDLDTQGLPEYDRIRLRLDAHDFVAIAAVSGGSAPNQADEVALPPSTLYDFSKEQLGSNFQLKLPTSSFRYLHIKLAAGIRPQQVKGATIYNLHEQKALWSKAGSCSDPQRQKTQTLITCNISPKIPLSRITFRVAANDVNFRRAVTIEDAKGVQVTTGEISRVRVNRAGTVVTSEELSVNVSENAGNLKVTVENGENPPLSIAAVEPLALERRIYFDPQGKRALKLYYGDENLASPTYDYARFFHLEPGAAEAQLGPGTHNASYTGRPDQRPWTEQHSAVLWAAMLVAVLSLAVLAVRGLRKPSSP